MATLGMKGNQAANTAGMDVSKWFLSMLPNLVTGTGAQSVQGMSGAAGSEAQIIASQNAANASKGSSNAGLLGSSMGAAASIAAK
jgi:hypothetical protein